MPVMSKVAPPAAVDADEDEVHTATIVPLLIKRLSKQLPRSTGMSAEETLSEPLFVSTRDFLRQVCGQDLVGEMLEGYMAVCEELADASGRDTALEQRPPRILDSLLVMARLLADTLLCEWDLAHGRPRATGPVFQATAKDVDDFYHGWLRMYTAFPRRIAGGVALRAIVFVTGLKSRTRVRNAVTRVFHDAYYEAPFGIVSQIDMCLDIAVWFLSASNWPEVYKFASSRFRALSNVQPDDLDAFPHLDVFSLLFLDEHRAAVLLRDVRQWITHIKRPVHRRLVTYFMRASIRYWVQTRPWEMLRAASDSADATSVASGTSGSSSTLSNSSTTSIHATQSGQSAQGSSSSSDKPAVTIEAEKLFDKMYRETNVAGNRVTATWELFVTLFMLIPESVHASFDHDYAPHKRRAQILLGPMAPASVRAGRKFSVMEELDKFITSPNPREVAVSVGCYSVIASMACFIRYLEPNHAIVQFAYNRYEPLKQTLLQAPAAHLPRYMNVDELQTDFTTAYFILRGSDFEKDVLSLLVDTNVSLRLQRNILKGLLNVTMLKETAEEEAAIAAREARKAASGSTVDTKMAALQLAEPPARPAPPPPSHAPPPPPPSEAVPEAAPEAETNGPDPVTRRASVKSESNIGARSLLVSTILRLRDPLIAMMDAHSNFVYAYDYGELDAAFSPQEYELHLEILKTMFALFSFCGERNQDLFQGIPETFSRAVVRCTISKNESLRTSTSESLYNFVRTDARAHKDPQTAVFPIYELLGNNIQQSARTLVVSQSPSNKTVEKELSHIKMFLDIRYFILDNYKFNREFLRRQEQMFEEVTSALETALMLALCSSSVEICKLALDNMRAMVSEALIFKELWPDANVVRNLPVYAELSSQSSFFTALAVQKKMFRLLQTVDSPSKALIKTWTIVYDRWTLLNARAAVADLKDSDMRRQWRSYSGVCCSLLAPLLDQGMSGTRIPDNVHFKARQFLQDSLNFILSESDYMRETTREILVSDVSVTLYQTILKELNEKVDRCLENREFGDKRGIKLLSETTLLVRSIIERLQDEGSYVSVDIGSLATKLVEHLHNAPDSVPYIKIRIRLCQLLESVGSAVDSFYAKHEPWNRVHVVMVLAEWLERSTSLRSSDGTGDSGSHKSRSDTSSTLYRTPLHHEEDWLIREKSVAVSKALLRLLDGLEIEVPDDTHEKERVAAKFNIFQGLFSMFLRILHRCKAEEEATATDNSSLIIAEKIPYIRSQTIACLSQLLNSNVEFGLKVALPLAYHEDQSVRLAFLEIMTNILNRTSGPNTAIGGGHAREELVDQLSEHMQITSVLCDICPAAEVDEFSMALLSTFDTRHRGLQLVEALIAREVENTSQGPDILRRNCVATKILSIFAKQRGRHYLNETLRPFIHKIVREPTRYVFETSRTNLVDEPDNVGRFERCWTELMLNLERTLGLIPESFYDVGQAIVASVAKAHPGFQETAVSSFFFLRLLCPTLVAPEQEGVVDEPLAPEVRKALLVLAKDIQTTAAGLASNSKETARDLERRRPVIKRLLTMLTTSNGPEQESMAASTTSGVSFPDETVSMDTGGGVGAPISDFQSFDVIHKYLYNHWDEAQRRLVAMLPAQPRKPSVGSAGMAVSERSHGRGLAQTSREHSQEHIAKDRSQSVGSAVSTADNSNGESLDAAAVRKVAQLIRALGRPDVQSSGAKTLHVKTSSRLYEFMERIGSTRDLGPVIDQRIVTEGIATQGLPALVVSVRNFNEKIADPNLLVYRFYQVASKLWANDFCIFYDLTAANPENEIWGSIRSFREMLMPEEMAKKVTAVYYYNVPSWYLPVVKNDMKRYQHGNVYLHPDKTKYIFLTSENAPAHVDVPGLNLHPDSQRVLDDARFQYRDTMRATVGSDGRFSFYPITIKLGSEFLQVHGVRPFHYARGSPGYCNDVIRLADIRAVYASNTTGKSHEFTLEITDKHKVVLLNPKCSEIVRAICNAKSRLGTTVAPKVEDKDGLTIDIEDTIGSFLNIGLTNICSTNSQLQEAAFNLLASIPHRFNVDFGREIRGGHGLRIPKYEVTMAVSISEAAAKSRPDLTLQFVYAFVKAFKASHGEVALSTVLYATPWMENVYKHVYLADDDGPQKTVAIVRRLLDLTVLSPSHHSVFLLRIWPALCLEPGLSELLVDEVVNFAVDRGIQENVEDVLAVITSFPTLSIAGTVLARCRDLLGKALAGERSLVNHPNWMEIVVLVKLISVLSFESLVIVETFLPDIFFLVTSLLYSGDFTFRQALHSLVVNVIHSFSCSSKLSEDQKERIMSVWNELSSSRGRLMFGLSDEMRDITYDYFVLTAVTHIENCCTMLLDVLSIVGNVSEANVWRTRWSSFALTSCFIDNPSLQCRSFLILGCLARLEVEDIVVTRVLDVLRTSLLLPKSELVEDFAACTLFCLTKMVGGLYEESNYVTRLFWLSVALMVSENAVVFNYATQLLLASLKAMDTRGMLRQHGMAGTLYRSLQSSDALSLWPDVEKRLRVTLTREHFDVGLCYIVLKGVDRSTTKPGVLRALETFLEISAKNYFCSYDDPTAASAYPPRFCCYLYFLYLVSPNPNDLKDLLWIAGYPDDHIEAYGKDEMPRLLSDYLDSDSLDSLLTLYIGGLLFCVSSEYDALGVRFLESLRTFKGKTSSRYMVYAMVRPRIVKLAAFGSQHPIMESMLATAVAVLANREEFDKLAQYRQDFKAILETAGFGATVLDEDYKFPAVSKDPISGPVARLLVDFISKTLVVL